MGLWLPASECTFCAAPLMHPSPTTSRIGRYEVLAPLGRGAMGVVYQARDPQIDRLVAIKTILWMGDEADEARDYRQRFMQEAKAAGRLSHPGIVQVFDVGQDAENNAPFIVMEYVPGQSLNKVLSASPGAKLPVQQALRLAEEIAHALAYAHSQGVVHRDIKPANILVTEDGHAKIADFGVAKLDFSNLTIAGHAVGTPAYMAPEQLGGQAVDGRADIFSLGVILYSMLAGFRPFQGRGNSTIAHKVRHGEPLPVTTLDVQLPPQVDALIARAMAKDPRERFQTGTEMATAIRTLVTADLQPGSSTDAQAVMQETRAHVACMGTEKSGSSGQVKTEGAPAPVPGATLKAAATPAKPAVPTSKGIPSKTASLANLRKMLPAWSSRRALATTLAASMLAATALAWRLHASFQPQPSPEPVAWETSQPTPATSDTSIAQPVAASDVTASPDSGNVPPTTARKAAAASSKTSATSVVKKAAKPKPQDIDDNEVASDRTVKLTPAKLVKVSSTAAPVVVPKQPAAAANADAATIQLALEHAFEEANVTVWIGDKQALTQSLHGEKKRMLMFQRTHGTFIDKLPVAAGQHLVRVRIQAPGESFDATQSVNGDFAKSAQYVLHARCDKKRKELKLDLEPVTVTSSAK
jgi:serine/threonine protein kinase